MQDVNGQVETMSWLMFQMGGLGPMQGQANHFVRYAPEKIEYGINRYTNETKRLYKVRSPRVYGSCIAVLVRCTPQQHVQRTALCISRIAKQGVL